jgi:hypothetical protein
MLKQNETNRQCPLVHSIHKVTRSITTMTCTEASGGEKHSSLHTTASTLYQQKQKQQKTQEREKEEETKLSPCYEHNSSDAMSALATTTLSLSSSSSSTSTLHSWPLFLRDGVPHEIVKHVIRQKLAKRRHLVVPAAIDPLYLESLFPRMLPHFVPQTVVYNGGIAQIPTWRISCYLEVMPGGIPTTHPNTALLHLYEPLLNACNDLFGHWYQQQQAGNTIRTSHAKRPMKCKRLMTFITRYTPRPGEQALLKVSGR